MKLWELRRAFIGFSEGPKLIGLLVRAECEAEAREFACREREDEHGCIWLDDELTACVELEPLTEGNAGVVLRQWIDSAGSV
jgi:hypothetical protein